MCTFLVDMIHPFLFPGVCISCRYASSFFPGVCISCRHVPSLPLLRLYALPGGHTCNIFFRQKLVIPHPSRLSPVYSHKEAILENPHREVICHRQLFSHTVQPFLFLYVIACIILFIIINNFGDVTSLDFKPQ